jgi:DNA-binding transcriptional LysR family regulator
MDAAQLQTFVQVARRGSITAAADELGYTQSAVSRQVAALEASIGAPLFDRRARGVDLTAHGQLLLPHAESLLERLEATRRALRDLDQVAGGHVRVGAFPTANALLIPQSLAAFRRAHPEVALSLVEGSTHHQLARLDAGDIDIAVVSAFPDQRLSNRRVTLSRLLDDRMLVALPRAHPLARRRRLRLAELAAESWIAGAADVEDRLLDPNRLQPDFEPTLNFVVREWTAKLGLVAAGLGITLVPSLAARAVRADIALVALHPDGRAARTVYAATARGRARSPAARAFLTVLRAQARTFASS